MEQAIKNKRRRLVWGALAAFIMMLIFAFSMENGAKSSQTSGHVAQWLLRLFYADFEAWPALRQEEMLDLWQVLVRKSAHFGIYACLGGVLLCFFRTFSQGKPSRRALLCAAAYACMDEFHQLFVPDRVGTLKDVLLDSLGAAFGIGIAMVCLRGVYTSMVKTKKNLAHGGDKGEA